jgi:hypothetical protein
VCVEVSSSFVIAKMSDAKRMKIKDEGMSGGVKQSRVGYDVVNENQEFLQINEMKNQEEDEVVMEVRNSCTICLPPSLIRPAPSQNLSNPNLALHSPVKRSKSRIEEREIASRSMDESTNDDNKFPYICDSLIPETTISVTSTSSFTTRTRRSDPGGSQAHPTMSEAQYSSSLAHR